MARSLLAASLNSALQALEDAGHCKSEFAQIIQDTNHLITSHHIRIAMQWIPGHSNTPGNDKAHNFSKKKYYGKNNHTTLQTVKQLLETVNKEDWLNRWTMGNTGREIYKYIARPNS
jgi:mannitol/fructose-specific phosphotransferase system IIA component (Ntr-type)